MFVALLLFTLDNQKDNLQRMSVISSSENKHNSSEQQRQPIITTLLIVASILVLSVAVLSTTLGNSLAQAANNNTAATSSSSSTKAASSGSSRDCLAIAANIGGQAVPRPDVCDVLILRQSPQIIMQPTNMTLNKFSTTNSLVEFMAMNTTKGASSSSTSNPKVLVMGEFGLLEPQLAPMLKAANSYNWTVSAIHNHMVLEKPKLIFVHWSAQGNLNTITTQIKNALIAIGKQPGTTSGNITAQGASNATTTSGSTPSSTSGNVTASVKPQGTSLQNTNQTTIGGNVSGPRHR
jgi:uncharacterized protein DUF1259